MGAVEPQVLINPPGRRLHEGNAIVSGLVPDTGDDRLAVEDFVGPSSIKSMLTALPPALFCIHCHCHSCRRAHGAAFGTWFGAEEEVRLPKT